jgi:protein gp37
MYRKKAQYHEDGSIVLRSKTKFREPYNWKDPQIIFTCSWSDWFVEDADPWRVEAWQVVKDNPHHTFQILTKRSGRIINHLPSDWNSGYSNVWLGVSLELEKYKERIDDLLKVPAAVRFVSIEPLLGPIQWDERLSALDWVIIGGESGNSVGKWRYRKSEIKWMEHLVNEATKNGVKVFVKQFGTHLAKELGFKDTHGGEISEWGAFPHLQVREMPVEALGSQIERPALMFKK